MLSFQNTKILPYTNRQLYSIIINVESYPEFLPWCKESEITNKIDDNNFDAMLTIGYNVLDENYTSRVKGAYQKQIESKAISGPFKYLDSNWIFNEYGKSSKVTFELNYEFKSFFLEKIMGAIFQKASEKMFSAFESRAKELYI